ncbi:UDP-glycosyltransferase 73C6 [Hordeum vulgare]|nr:UDP-glycosyltransferase 73C6 [Hordeum vulgare]
MGVGARRRDSLAAACSASGQSERSKTEKCWGQEEGRCYIPRGFTPGFSPGPSTGLAHDLFMAPQTTSTAGGVAPALAVGPHAPFSKLPNAAMAKKGKVSGKKNKAADGSFRRPKKRLVGRAKDAAATEASTSSLAASAANGHNMFDEMPPSFSDETYTSTMGVGFNNSHWSQTNELTIAQNLFQEEEKKTKKGRPFTLPHCCEELKDDEKWKPREGVNEEINKHKQTIDLNDDEGDASSDDDKRSPTANSVSYSKTKRLNGGKKDAKEKKKRK